MAEQIFCLLIGVDIVQSRIESLNVESEFQERQKTKRHDNLDSPKTLMLEILDNKVHIIKFCENKSHKPVNSMMSQRNQVLIKKGKTGK